ncbi:hypothetical protein [Archangium sp.]|uniref:hypothetical protein n=1 Tax=Archangium sp. TaxID=1872627 RepID=UPI002D391FBC|nr:hypothetical protein [Archangium sp.]HYO59971.1 hypothetical protein [Archangium sp.]
MPALAPPMRLHFLRNLLPTVMLLATPAALAQPVNHQLSLGVGLLNYTSFRRPSPLFTVLEAAYHLPVGRETPWHSLRIGGGLRTGLPAAASHLPLEGFVQVQLTGKVGPWEAAVGPELGLSGFGKLVRIPLPSDELFDMEDERLGPAYMALHAAPLRFRFGWLALSALELSIGTPLSSPGTALRLHLGLLRFGVSL